MSTVRKAPSKAKPAAKSAAKPVSKATPSAAPVEASDGPGVSLEPILAAVRKRLPKARHAEGEAFVAARRNELQVRVALWRLRHTEQTRGTH